MEVVVKKFPMPYLHSLFALYIRYTQTSITSNEIQIAIAQ